MDLEIYNRCILFNKCRIMSVENKRFHTSNMLAPKSDGKLPQPRRFFIIAIRSIPGRRGR